MTPIPPLEPFQKCIRFGTLTCPLPKILFFEENVRSTCRNKFASTSQVHFRSLSIQHVYRLLINVFIVLHENKIDSTALQQTR